MTTTIAKSHVRGALTRVRDALVEAAGDDKRLSRAELAKCLATLAPTERAAVDAFAHTLFAREKKGGHVTVADIDRALRGSQRRLAPKTGPDAIDVDELAARQRMGNAIVELAQRLAGVPGDSLPAPIPAHELAGLRGDDLLQALRARCLPHIDLGYGTARDVMFHVVDDVGGTVRDVYAGRVVPVVDRAAMNDANHVNTEHTYPRSLGVEATPALADLHHLFPTDALANGKRSSLPFGDVVTVLWEPTPPSGAKLGTDKDGKLVFEVPDAQKGDTARALLYVSAIYGLKVPEREERALRRWNRRDAVDDVERARNDAIASVQENRNPFVDDPKLVHRIRDF